MDPSKLPSLYKQSKPSQQKEGEEPPRNDGSVQPPPDSLCRESQESPLFCCRYCMDFVVAEVAKRGRHAQFADIELAWEQWYVQHAEQRAQREEHQPQDVPHYLVICPICGQQSNYNRARALAVVIRQMNLGGGQAPK